MNSQPAMASSPFTRRSLFGAGISAAALSVLSACSGGGTPGAGNTGGGSLSWWSRDAQSNGALEPVIRAALASFDKKNTTTTEAQFLTLADSSQKELAALTGGGLPTLGEQGQDISMQFAEGGHTMSLDDLYAGLKDKFVELPKAAVTEYNGHVYAMPWWLETRVLWYHKDLLDKAGVQPPTTWDEWINATKALTRGSEQYGFAAPAQGVPIGQLFTSQAAAAGGTMLDAQGKLDTTPDAFVEALQFMEKLFKAGMPPAAITYAGTITEQLFLAKKIAMTWDNGTILQMISSTKPELLDTVGAVLTPAITQGGKNYSFLGGFEVFAFKDGQGSSRAKDLLSFLYGDPTTYGKIMTAGGGITLPILSAAAKDSQWQSGPRQVLVEQLKTACRYSGPAYGTHGYMGQAEANLIFTNPVADVFSGKSTPQDAVKQMFDQLTKLAAGS